MEKTRRKVTTDVESSWYAMLADGKRNHEKADD